MRKNISTLGRISKYVMLSFFLFTTAVHAGDSCNLSEIEALKKNIIELAESYKGQPDQDFSKQKSLDVLVNQLLALAPQPPVAQRLELLYGPWEQVWGPYDYRNNDRGVDPELGVDEIYQVIFPDGYYYNVSPLYKKGNRNKERIGLLRGEFKLDESEPNVLRVQFTSYPGVKPRPTEYALWELPALAESKELKNRITIVPSVVVRLFFGAGALREVYTDENLRIAYGSNGKNFEDESIYILRKVKN